MIASVLFVPRGAVAQEEPLRLGMSAAFTGPSATLGIELYRGAKAYFDEINSKGGIRGRKLVLVAYDDGYAPEPCVENTVRLVEKDKVFALFGYVGTSTTSRILPLLRSYRNEHVQLMFPMTGAVNLRRAPYRDYVFNLRASYFHETFDLVERLADAGLTRIAVLHQADAYGRTGWDGVRRALARRRLAMVAEATYRRGAGFDQDMSRQVEILMQAKPQAVISVGTHSACAAFVRDARDAGFGGPIAQLSFVDARKMIDLLLEAGREVDRDYTSNLIMLQAVPDVEDASLPAVAEFRRLMDKWRPGPPPGAAPAYRPRDDSPAALEGYLDARFFVALLRHVRGSLTRREFRRILDVPHVVDLGLKGAFVVMPGSHQAQQRSYAVTFEDGAVKPLQGVPGVHP